MKFSNMLLACLAMLLVLSACNRNKEVPVASKFRLTDTMLAASEFSTVEMQDVRRQLRLFGKIAADHNKTAQVNTIVSGLVTSINVELGDYVKQGQVLATLQSSDMAHFQKERLDAISDVAIAEKNLQVVKDLFGAKLASDKELTAAQRELEKAHAELERINEVYRIYSLSSGSKYNIVAPVSGFVLNKNINQNEQIRSDGAEPLFSIAEISEVWVMANVNESDIGKVQVGYNATMKTLAFPDEVYQGKIDKIFNAIDPQTKSMKVRVKLPNADFKLKPEMNCTVEVSFSENKQMPAVPSSAVIFDKNKYWVMVYRNPEDIDTRQVEVYRQLGNIAYISSGLQPGEKVMSKNGLLVYDALND